MTPDLLHHCLKSFLIKGWRCRLGSRGIRVGVAALRQGQFHICHPGIFRHDSPMGWRGGSEGLVGVAGLLVSKGFLQKSHASSQNMWHRLANRS